MGGQKEISLMKGQRAKRIGNFLEKKEKRRKKKGSLAEKRGVNDLIFKCIVLVWENSRLEQSRRRRRKRAPLKPALTRVERRVQQKSFPDPIKLRALSLQRTGEGRGGEATWRRQRTTGLTVVGNIMAV